MWSLIVKGGPVMIPILAGSVIGLALVIERFWVFRSIKMDTSEFVHSVFKLLKNRQIEKALELCEKNRYYPIAAIFKIGIERRDLAVERLEKVLEQAGNNQMQRLEKRLGGLASLVGIEPLLGFLGTITGLIQAFMSWEKAGANVTVNALAQGIYQAMITTAAGLMVAIPGYLFYNYFISRTKYIANELTNYSIQLTEVLNELK